jgi:cytochrome c-type biogenesis protein
MVQIDVLTAFLAGLLSFLSPCVLPLVPPYLCFLAGVSVEEWQETSPSFSLRMRILNNALTFVMGFATVFVLLGATASLFGQWLARYSYELGVASGLLIILFGLHFLGVFRLSFLERSFQLTGQPAKVGMAGSYMIGLAFGFGWTPCIGPVLASVLLVASQQANVGAGAGLLFIYAMGIGLPFLLAALAAGFFLRMAAPVKRHMLVIGRVTGLLLVVTGLLFLTGFMARFSYFLLESFPALGRLG